MALTSTRADANAHLEPWQRACDRFLEGLSPGQAKLFTSSNLSKVTLEDLFYSADVAQRGYREKSRSVKLHAKVQPFVDVINDYASALDVFSNIAPIYIAPVWGSIRVLIQVANSHVRRLQYLTETLHWIGTTLPRLRIYENIYFHHVPLLNILTEIYVSILNLCCDVKNDFGHNGHLSVPYFIIRRPKRRYEHQLNALRKYGECAELESAAASRLYTERRRQKDSISGLCSLDYAGKHQRVETIRFGGTGLWLFENSSFKSWLEDSTTSGLALYGIPGSGKTVLVSNLIGFLNSLPQDGNAAVCYHYCDYADTSSLDVANIYRSMVKQLLALKTERVQLVPKAIASLIDEAAYPGSLSSSASARAFLQRTMRQFPEVYLAIDGLDELADQDQRQVLDFMEGLRSDQALTVKVLTSCRQAETQVKRALQSYHVINLEPNNVLHDIRLFVTESIEEKLQSGEMTILDLGLKDVIINRLVAGAKDMFLWATLQIHEICEAMTDLEIWQILENLPLDLTQTFARILSRISRSRGGRSKIDTTRKVFQWLLCVRRPILLKELREAVSLSPGDTNLNQQKFPDPEKLIRCCGNLIRIEGDRQVVTIAHHTIQKYLLETQQENRKDEFNVLELSDPDTYVAEVCVTFIMLADFKTTLAKSSRIALTSEALNEAVIPKTRLAKTTSQIRGHLISQPSTTSETVALDPSNMVDDRQSSQLLSFKYKLLSYVAEFWLEHTKHLNIDNPSFPLFEMAITRTQLPSLSKPWDCDSRLQPDYTSMLQWSLQNSHLGLLHALRHEGNRRSLFQNIQDNKTCPFQLAYEHSDSRMVTYIWGMIETENWIQHPKCKINLSTHAVPEWMGMTLTMHFRWSILKNYELAPKLLAIFLNSSTGPLPASRKIIRSCLNNAFKSLVVQISQNAVNGLLGSLLGSMPNEDIGFFFDLLFTAAKCAADHNRLDIILSLPSIQSEAPIDIAYGILTRTLKHDDKSLALILFKHWPKFRFQSAELSARLSDNFNIIERFNAPNVFEAFLDVWELQGPFHEQSSKHKSLGASSSHIPGNSLLQHAVQLYQGRTFANDHWSLFTSKFLYNDLADSEEHQRKTQSLRLAKLALSFSEEELLSEPDLWEQGYLIKAIAKWPDNLKDTEFSEIIRKVVHLHVSYFSRRNSISQRQLASHEVITVAPISPLDVMSHSDDKSALYLAVSSYNLTMLRALLESGANPTLSETRHMSALTIAVERWDEDLIDMLLQSTEWSPNGIKQEYHDKGFPALLQVVSSKRRHGSSYKGLE